MLISFFPRSSEKKIEILIYVIYVSIIIIRRRIKMLNHPEFYLLVQQEHNRDFMHTVENICLCGISALIAFGGVMMSYNLFFYADGISKYLWITLWSYLTMKNKWIDLIMIGISIICSGVIILSMKGIADVVENGIIKLKNEIKKKDERIRELETKLEALELEQKNEIKVEKGEC
jgi:hypothetical protein